MSNHSTYLCPRCEKPMVDKCWQCGYNTASYEETTGITYSEWYDMQQKKKLTGGFSSYYQLPKGCKELQDLIEYKNMNFARGNVFKAAYRLGDKPGTDQIYDWEKIIWFAQREIERLKKDV